MIRRNTKKAIRISKKAVMRLARHYFKTDSDGQFGCFADALWQSWRDAKAGRWPVNTDELEGQRSEHAYNQYKMNIARNYGF